MVIPEWLMIQIAIVLVGLTVATSSDIPKREVTNKVFAAMFAGGLGVQFLFFGSTPILLGINLMIGLLVMVGALAVWFVATEKVGAADIKAFMVLGFCVPTLILQVIGFMAVAVLIFILVEVILAKKPRAEIIALKVPLMPFLLAGSIATVFWVFFV